MPKVALYNMKAEQIGEVELNELLFGSDGTHCSNFACAFYNRNNHCVHDDDKNNDGKNDNEQIKNKADSFYGA